MSTTLDATFLRAVILVASFRGNAMDSCCAALLIIGLHKAEFCAGELPADLLHGSTTLAGCATGSLITQGLLEVVGRVKSPNPAANGRKMNLLRIPPNRVATVRAWLRSNGYAVEEVQAELFA